MGWGEKGQSQGFRSVRVPPPSHSAYSLLGTLSNISESVCSGVKCGKTYAAYNFNETIYTEAKIAIRCNLSLFTNVQRDNDLIKQQLL